MPVFRYHFSTREYYRVDIRANTLKEAIEALEYAGVHYQNEENSEYLDDAWVDCDEECYGNKTRTYNCYGIPVDLTVPEKEHIPNDFNWWPFSLAKVGEAMVPMNHGEVQP